MTVQASFRAEPLDQVVISRGAEVIRIEADALNLLAKSLGASFAEACDVILSSRGRVVVTGMGKSGHIGRKWAATMAATGTPAIYVHPAEAAHGDLGMLIAGDVLIVISNSGNTVELKAFLAYAASIGVKIIGVASRLDSLVMQNADIKLLYPAAREACSVNIAPTTSTTMQLAMGDALALSLMDSRGFSLDGMKILHPGGSLGLRMTSVRELMHGPAKMPLVDRSASMREAVLIMTSTGFGMAGVLDEGGSLVGVITDGDIRRHFDDLANATANEVMSANPKTVFEDTIAEDALLFLNENKITGAFVMNRKACNNRLAPIGFVHIHDFLRLGLG